MQIRRKEEAADHASADLARKVAALDQKDRSAAEKEQSLSSLTAELWAKASVAVYKCLSLQTHSSATAFPTAIPLCKYFALQVNVSF